MANSQISFPSFAEPLTVRRAAVGDLPLIMALERGPDFEACVGRSDRDEHEAMLGSPRYGYFLGLDAAAIPRAFAILRDLDDPHGNLYLKRVAVAAPGQGFGSQFLAQLVDWAFAETGAYRFYLDCFDDNARAHKAYAKLGLTRDGTLRGAYLAPDGRRRDLVLMAITRPEWFERRRSFAVAADASRAAP